MAWNFHLVSRLAICEHDLQIGYAAHVGKRLEPGGEIAKCNRHTEGALRCSRLAADKSQSLAQFIDDGFLHGNGITPWFGFHADADGKVDIAGTLDNESRAERHARS